MAWAGEQKYHIQNQLSIKLFHALLDYVIKFRITFSMLFLLTFKTWHVSFGQACTSYRNIFWNYCSCSTYRWHIIRGPNVSLRKAALMMQHSGQTKVSQLDIGFRIQKHVGWFEVTVKDSLAILSLVAFFQGHGCLDQYLPDKVFRNTSAGTEPTVSITC